jgi:Asp-tRNA(Asn)/Glu-tRNA(Gln) amidotransferase A subunit family amidase
MKFAAESLDTIGLITRTVEDAALVTDCCIDRPPLPLRAPAEPPRIGVTRNVMWDEHASPETKRALEETAARARTSGAIVRELELGPEFKDLFKRRGEINDYERACGLAWEWAHHRELLSPQMTRTVEQGLAIPHDRYVDTLHLAERCRLALEDMMRPFDVLLTPSVDGEAPVGLDYAGNPAFQALWTMLHVPAITLPLAKGPHGMPVGVQLIAARHADRKLLEVARWLIDLA